MKKLKQNAVTLTSQIAYSEINEDGTSLNQKEIIMNVIKIDSHTHSSGLSLREIQKLTGLGINAVSGRVNDLKKEGLLETTKKRKCTITGRLIAPVIIKEEEIINDINGPQTEDEYKLSLLLKINGCPEHVFLESSELFNERYVKIRNWEKLADDVIENINNNMSLELKEHLSFKYGENYYFFYSLNNK